MRFQPLKVLGAYLIDIEPHGDERGFVAHAFTAAEFAARGIHANYPQTNISLNLHRGTLRGIHYRADGIEPKLLRCIAGAIYDVIVDLRPNSPTYLEWAAVELSKSNRSMLFVPGGCGHGFQTLLDDTEIIYQMGAPYVPDLERGVRWDDPVLSIPWPLVPTQCRNVIELSPTWLRRSSTLFPLHASRPHLSPPLASRMGALASGRHLVTS